MRSSSTLSTLELLVEDIIVIVNSFGCNMIAQLSRSRSWSSRYILVSELPHRERDRYLINFHHSKDHHHRKSRPSTCFSMMTASTWDNHLTVW